MARKKAPQRRQDIFTAYTRGDDSILNAGSSAERRYLEGMAIVVGSQLAIPKDLADKVSIDLSAMFALPAETGGGVVSVSADVAAGTTAGIIEAVVPGPAGALLGGLVAKLGTKLNPTVKVGGGIDESNLQSLRGLKISPFSLAQVALTAGYLMEKGLGDQIGSVLTGAGKLAEGISPELVRVEIDGD